MGVHVHSSGCLDGRTESGWRRSRASPHSSQDRCEALQQPIFAWPTVSHLSEMHIPAIMEK